jgi:hypothetical protein
VRVALFFAVCVLVAKPVRAEVHLGRASLEVTRSGKAADSCPDEATFAASVARMMHTDAAVSSIRVTVVMRAETDRVDGSVTMEADGAVTMERRLHGKACHDVGEGLALIVALAIDPLADPALPALPPVVPTKVETPIPQPEVPVHRTEAPRVAAKVHVHPPTPVQPFYYGGPLVAARLMWGVEPGSTGEIVLGAEVGWRGRWAPSMRIDGGPLVTTSIVAGGGTVVFSGGDIEAVGCPLAIAIPKLAFVASACLSGGATIVATRSVGFAVQRDTTSTIGFLGATLSMRARIVGPLGVILEGGLRFPLDSFEWDVQGYGAIGKTSPVAGTTSIGLDIWVP